MELQHTVVENVEAQRDHMVINHALINLWRSGHWGRQTEELRRTCSHPIIPGLFCHTPAARTLRYQCTVIASKNTCPPKLSRRGFILKDYQVNKSSQASHHLNSLLECVGPSIPTSSIVRQSSFIYICSVSQDLFSPEHIS